MKLRLAEQQHGPVYSIDSIFSEKELSLAGNQAHVAAVHFFARSKRHKANNANAETDEGSAGSEKEDAHAAAPEAEKAASQNVHVTRSTRANGGQVTLSLLGDGERSKDRPNSPYFILSNYHAKPSGAGNAPPLPPLMPEEVDEDLAKIDKCASKPPSQVDSQLLDKLMEAIDDNDGLDPDTVNKFSMLHPDFPPTMDVHLVRLHPEKE
ncbi:hypothetical protein KEM55_006449 [Ascosphaera atra]|nr:hypothetical protein KEM55_006449 [Ascosphaera atra]